jgi:predicted nucleic acid-binding protein
VLYLDSSALVKLYVRETHSADVMALARKSPQWLCHQVGYVEVRAALAAAERLERISAQARSQAVARFIKDWRNISQVQFDEALLERAAELAEGFGLRGYDSVHLAAADRIRDAVGERLVFACFDERLNRAAKLIGISLPEFASR